MNFYGGSSLLTLANQLSQQQYQWGQDQFAKNSNLTDQVVNNYLSGSSTAMGAANHDLSRYENLFQPQENQLIADANSYAGSGRIQANMGAAASEAGQASEQQRQAALQDLQSYGIDPSSGRYAALDTAQRAREAASEAGAANTARAQTEQVGRGLRSEAIQVGQRYPGQVVNYLNTALQGLTGAENATLANSNTGVNMMGSPTAWGALSLQARQQMMNRPNNATMAGGKGGGGGGYGPQPQTPSGGESSMDWNGSAPSALNGSGAIHSNASGDWTPIDDSSGGGGGSNDWGNEGSGGYAMGGSVQGQSHGAIPLGDDATSGGHVPRSASPSNGKVTDDIHARLNADEFVVPRDAVQWKGHEFFHKLIKKSREDRHVAVHESGAKPKMKAALAQPPSFVSHHVQGALPIG